MQAVLTAAVEAGICTFLFNASSASLARDWSQLARFTAMLVDGFVIMDAATNTKVPTQTMVRSNQCQFVLRIAILVV